MKTTTTPPTMKTLHLRLVVSAAYDLSEVPDDDLESVRRELHHRLSDMPEFYAGLGEFTGSTPAMMDEWDVFVSEDETTDPFDALHECPELPDDFDTDDGREAFRDAFTEWRAGLAKFGIQ